MSFPRYSIGHFINAPERTTEVELLRFERMEEPDVDDPHIHTFYEVLWVEEGRTEQTIDHVAYAVEPGSLFFISPGQLHGFEAWQPLRGGSLLFTEHFFLQGLADGDALFSLSFLDNLYSSPLLKPNVIKLRRLTALA
jgi:AraC family transcriptional regulator, transcriptional activator of pobA